MQDNEEQMKELAQLVKDYEAQMEEIRDLQRALHDLAMVVTDSSSMQEARKKLDELMS